MSLPNPFTPGQVPRVLAGRVQERRRIGDQVARVSTYAELGGPLMVFHAPRGLGKTSLLRAAQTDAEEAGAVTTWVACSRKRAFLPELVRALDRDLGRADVTAKEVSTPRWRKLVEQVSVEFSVPGLPVKVSADLATREEPPPVLQAPIGALESLLHETATMIRRRGERAWSSSSTSCTPLSPTRCPCC